MGGCPSILINRFFSRNMLREILSDGCSSTFTSVADLCLCDTSERTNANVISEVYDMLNRNYRNEYFYKNTLLNKRLLGVHSIQTTTALSEVQVADSKADFVLINGKAVVYEIKTEFDNFERLDKQIQDYYSAFTLVNVVVSESKSQIDRAFAKLQTSPVGIIVLTKKGTLREVKQAEERVDTLSKSVMFKMLRKPEYESLILTHRGRLPDVSQFKYYKECENEFSAVPFDSLYDEFLKTLKLRARVSEKDFSSVPYELKSLVYFSDLTHEEYLSLFKFLEE